jgi:hypothetical protein
LKENSFPKEYIRIGPNCAQASDGAIGSVKVIRVGGADKYVDGIKVRGNPIVPSTDGTIVILDGTPAEMANKEAVPEVTDPN